MIDHIVTIGGDSDISNSVVSIEVVDQIDTSSDPGKIKVVLANRPSIMAQVASWKPQTTPIEIILKNWVYGSGQDYDYSEYAYSRYAKKSEESYHVAYGHLVGISRSNPSPSEITVLAECDLGHLADALGPGPKKAVVYGPQQRDSPDFKSGTFKGWTHEVLPRVLALHKSLDITLHYQARTIEYAKEKNYNSETTFQEVLEDLAADVGAVYYFDEDGILQFRDPRAIRSDAPIVLDPYVLNPNDTDSIVGHRNRVTVIGDQTLADGEMGRESPGSEPLMYTAEDQDSIDEYGVLEAPTDRAIWLGSMDKVQERAELLLNFYKMFENATTSPVVAGIVPPLHSLVSYDVFLPIDGTTPTKATVSGIVIARHITYDITGLRTELTVSPGATEMEQYTGEEQIREFTVDI